MPTTIPDKLDRQRFRLAIGQAARLRFILKDPPDDVGDWSMRFRIRHDGDDEPLVDLSSGSGIEALSAEDAGEGNAGWDVSIARSDTIDAEATEANWSLWNVASGSENPNAIGTVTLFLTADGNED